MPRVVATLAAVVLAVAMAAPVAAGDSFTGHWEATDTDGSNMTLDIWATGARYRTVLYDDGGSVCGVFDEDGNPTVGAVVWGTGTATGVTLTVPFTGKCVTNGARPFRGTSTFEYDSGTDTLWDGSVTWHRS
jgi:hypothetical protein